MKKFSLLAAPVVASAVLCSSVVAAGATEVTSSPVVVNEMESNGDPIGDFVELANKDTNNSVDSGLRATQKAAAHRTRKA